MLCVLQGNSSVLCYQIIFFVFILILIVTWIFMNFIKSVFFRNSAKFYPVILTCAAINMSDSQKGRTWFGEDLDTIRGSSSPYGEREFPFLNDPPHHVVLYKVPMEPVRHGRLLWEKPLTPSVGEDQWNRGFVKLPCSPSNSYNGESRWDKIQRALSVDINNMKELTQTIQSYNSSYKWTFVTLYEFEKHLTDGEKTKFFQTIKEMAKLALELPDVVKAPIPLLRSGTGMTLSFTQKQIACLLANAFFCTFPHRNSERANAEYASYPNINFNGLFEATGEDVEEKIKCFINYFRRVTESEPLGVVTFARRSVPYDHLPNWEYSEAPLSIVPLHVNSDQRIEEADGLIQLDFANKYLGGGVLGHGSVQEEIRFAVCPELVVSKLFTEKLYDNEAVLIIGAERYSDYIGYSRMFHWHGDHFDDTPYDSAGRRRTAVLAIDAINFRRKKDQFRTEKLKRELDKAYVGFSFYAEAPGSKLNIPGVATGNWGCGAFNGSPQLKSLLQLMACAETKRPMAYVTFGDTDFRDEFFKMYNHLTSHGVTVGGLYRLILKFAETDRDKVELYKFLYNEVGGGDSPQHQNKRKADIRKYVKRETTRQEITDPIQAALHSPDLFSQEDEQRNSGSDTETNKPSDTKTQTQETPEQNRKRKYDKMAADEPEIASKMAATSKPMTSQSHTTRLFDVMQKFDEDNGRLNLSVSHTSPVNQRSSLVVSDSDHSMDSEENDVASEMKRIRTKITDYFSRNPE